MVRRLAVLALVAVSSVALAQSVNVNVNLGGGGTGVDITGANGKKVKVDTRGGAVKVDSDEGTTAADGKGNASVKTKKGTAQVKGGGAQVEAAGDADDGDEAPAAGGVTGAAEGEFSVMDNGQKVDHTCKPGETVGVLGNTNTVSLHGPCAKVSVSGNKNTVSVDQVGAIDAMGNQNAVTWKAALKGKAPQVSALGTGNAVTQAR